MGALRRALLLGGLLAAVPAEAGPADRWSAIVEQASVRFGIPARWIEQVMIAESRGRALLDGRPIRSRAGAMGLMQLMPATWAAMRARLKLGDDPDDPRDNILAGAAFLRRMYDRFGYPGLFAAYNVGPGRYARFLAGEGRLPDETRAYLAAVTAGITERPPHRPPALFALRHDDPDARADASPPVSLFAVRRVTP